jgi:hypothetical protein
MNAFASGMNRISKAIALAATIGTAGYATYVASAFLRYGRPRRAKGKASDALLDQFMPRYDVVERHELELDAPPSATFAAAKEMDFDDSRIVRAIFKGRELLMHSKGQAAPAPKGLVAKTLSMGWGLLAEVSEREIVIGAVTKPWKANPVFRAVSPDEFASFSEPDYVKIAWTLRADPTDDGGSVFRTETRAIATDAQARKKFRVYWSFLSPGIILIRSTMLPSLRDGADRKWRVEGDDILANAGGQLTHAITIDAAPRDIWPWLVQMGCQRAGWYSWDVLDNGRKPSASRIVPELQHLSVGDVLPARPVGTEGFKVLRIVPERALILGSLTPDWDGTWAFELEPLAGGRTRLVTRYRAASATGLKMRLLLPLYAAVHAFMERKQLRTIKARAEHMYVRSVTQPAAASWADAT